MRIQCNSRDAQQVVGVAVVREQVRVRPVAGREEALGLREDVGQLAAAGQALAGGHVADVEVRQVGLRVGQPQLHGLCKQAGEANARDSQADEPRCSNLYGGSANLGRCWRRPRRACRRSS